MKKLGNKKICNYAHICKRIGCFHYYPHDRQNCKHIYCADYPNIGCVPLSEIRKQKLIQIDKRIGG